MRARGFQRAVVVCAIALLPGCAAQRAGNAPALAAASAEGTAAHIAPGRIAVVAARDAPEASYGANVQYKAVTTLVGAGLGAGFGALVGVLMWAPLPTPAIEVLAPITAVGGAIVGGAVGSVGGARNGMRWEHVTALHRPIEGLGGTSVHEALARRLVDEAHRAPGYELTYVGALGPVSPAGFDSVLEVAVTRLGFDADKGEPPSAIFQMAARIRVVRAGHEALDREFLQRGEWRSVTAWASDDGRLWQQELDAAYAGLASDISKALFSPVSRP